MIKLYYYTAEPNFGDMISPIIFEAISGLKTKRVSYADKGKFLAVGSIVHNAKEGDVVWGSGSIQNKEIFPPKNITYLAVRGPLTRNLIHADVPEVYGDPALLLPEIYPAKKDKKYKIGLMPHYIDQDIIKDPWDQEVLWIDVTKDPYGVIDQMNLCETIIASNLHGVITAEAYGIPVIWVRASNRICGGSHKFNDYFLSTGREMREPEMWRNDFRNLKKVLPKPIIDTRPLKNALIGYLNET